MFKSVHEQHFFEKQLIDKIRSSSDNAYLMKEIQRCFGFLSEMFFKKAFELNTYLFFNLKKDDYISKAMCLGASYNKKIMFYDFPKEMLTEDVLYNCLKNNPQSISTVPVSLVTPRMWKVILQPNHLELIIHIPPYMRTKEMWHHVLDNCEFNEIAGHKIINNISCDKTIDTELLLKAIAKSKVTHSDIPEEYFTYDMWKYLLKYNFPDNFRLAPQDIFNNPESMLFVLNDSEIGFHNIRLACDKYIRFKNLNELKKHFNYQIKKKQLIMDYL